MRIFAATATAVVIAATPLLSAQSPNYTYQMRLIPDGAAGASSGSWAMYPLPVTLSGTARIGFWLQARVSQDSGENWGVARVSSPFGGTSSITASASGWSASLTPGGVNASGLLTGRGSGYRAGSSGAVNNLVGFDAYVGSTRQDPDTNGDGDPDDDGDGLSENPWGVNGSTVPGVPVPSGEFSPWANIYRVYADVNFTPGAGSFTVTAVAQVNGSIRAAPTDPVSGSWALQLGQGQTLSATYSIAVPSTPAAAAFVLLGALGAGRRRR